MKLIILLSAFLAVGVSALSPCDNEAGQVCPMASGKEVGECLSDPSKHSLTDIDGNPRELEPGEKPMELSEDCKKFIEINKGCDADIEEHCQGMFFQGDTMTCLTDWKKDAISDACKEFLPKQQEASDEVDAEKAAWRAKRKAARGQAIKDIEKETKRREKEDKKAKKDKRKAKKDNKEREGGEEGKEEEEEGQE